MEDDRAHDASSGRRGPVGGAPGSARPVPSAFGRACARRALFCARRPADHDIAVMVPVSGSAQSRTRVVLRRAVRGLHRQWPVRGGLIREHAVHLLLGAPDLLRHMRYARPPEGHGLIHGICCLSGARLCGGLRMKTGRAPRTRGCRLRHCCDCREDRGPAGLAADAHRSLVIQPVHDPRGGR